MAADRRPRGGATACRRAAVRERDVRRRGHGSLQRPVVAVPRVGLPGAVRGGAGRRRVARGLADRLRRDGALVRAGRVGDRCVRARLGEPVRPAEAARLSAAPRRTHQRRRDPRARRARPGPPPVPDPAGDPVPAVSWPSGLHEQGVLLGLRLHGRREVRARSRRSCRGRWRPVAASSAAARSRRGSRSTVEGGRAALSIRAPTAARSASAPASWSSPPVVSRPHGCCCCRPREAIPTASRTAAAWSARTSCSTRRVQRSSRPSRSRSTGTRAPRPPAPATTSTPPTRGAASSAAATSTRAPTAATRSSSRCARSTVRPGARPTRRRCAGPGATTCTAT